MQRSRLVPALLLGTVLVSACSDPSAPTPARQPVALLASGSGGSGGGGGGGAAPTWEQMQSGVLLAIEALVQSPTFTGAIKDMKALGVPGVDNNTLFQFKTSYAAIGTIQGDPHRTTQLIPAGTTFWFKGGDTAGGFFIAAERYRLGVLAGTSGSCPVACPYFVPVLPVGFVFN